MNDILDFSRIEAGKTAIDAIPFNLHDQLRSCMREMAAQAHGKGLERMLDVERGGPEHVMGDPARVKQIRETRGVRLGRFGVIRK